MQSSKLIKLLKLLSKEECRKFKKLLQSPFFTTNKHLVKIYDYLLKDYPNFSSPKLDKASIFTHLFPKAKYNDNKLRMLFREFTRQLEDFLIIKETLSQEDKRRKELIHIYGKRNQMEFFEKGTFQLLEEMEVTPVKNKNHFFEQQQLIQEFIYHPSAINIYKHSQLQISIMEYLDIYYWANKIWLSCNILSIQKFIKVEYSSEELDLIIPNIPSNYIHKHPPLDTYIKAFQFLKNSTESHYYTFKKSYLRTLNQISKSDKRDLFTYLFNHSILKANQGISSFELESFHLYKIGLEEKLLIEHGRFDDNTFINCYTIALSLKEFDWAKKFLHTYKQYLNKENINDTSKLCQAYLLFFKQDFISLIDLITSYQFERFIDLFRVKSLLLRCYFELFLIDESYYNVFVSYCHSHEKFFRRNDSIVKKRKDLYINLINLLRRIAKVIHDKKWEQEINMKFIQKATDEKIALKQGTLKKLQNLKAS